MRPFFSFYGGKWGLSRTYPKPKFNLVIEPFAGSAGYSVRNNSNCVVLCDSDSTIVAIWRFLIASTRNDILSLPLEIINIDSLGLPFGASAFLGFWISRGSSTPAKSPSAWMRSGKYRSSFWSESKRQRIAEQVMSIKNWRIIHGDYSAVLNMEATWFIDPPYREKGSHYKHSSAGIDYPRLGDWCRKRKGQVIVTENSGADWLPFHSPRPLRGVRNGGKKMSEEVVWTNTHGN